MIGVAILSVASISILGGLTIFLAEGSKTVDRTAALYLLDEGVEAVRFLRDGSFDLNIVPLSVGTTYYLTTTSANAGWTLSTSPIQILSEYEVTVLLDDVYRRNADNDIVPLSSPDVKTLDPNARKVTVVASWNDTRSNATSSATTTTYITRLFDN